MLSFRVERNVGDTKVYVRHYEPADSPSLYETTRTLGVGVTHAAIVADVQADLLANSRTNYIAAPRSVVGSPYSADTLSNPTASDAVTAIAQQAVDSVSPELLNRLFDDTIEQAAVLADEVCPMGMGSLLLTTWARPIVPVASKTMQFRLYGMDTSGAPSAWSSAVAMDVIDTTASSDWIKTTHAPIPIASLNIVQGQSCRMNLARNPAADSLVGDAAVLHVQARWLL